MRAGYTDLLEHEAVEELARAPDERQTLEVLLFSGALTNEHEVGLRVSGAEHHVGAANRKPAASAPSDLARQLVKQRHRSIVGIHAVSLAPVVAPVVVTALAPAPDDMRRLGAVVAELLRPGDTVLLGGDLGSGKTTFTQGLAAALGVEGPVTSPTFVLVHHYPTAAGWDLLHADVWRLEQLQEVIDLAIPELQEEGAAAVVEWGELASPALAGDCLHVAIAFEPEARAAPEREGDLPAGGAAAGPGGARRVSFRASGPSWLERMGALGDGVESTGLAVTERTS